MAERPATLFSPSSPSGRSETAVLLGFSSPFSRRPVTLFIDVEPRSPSAALAPASPARAGDLGVLDRRGWAALSAEDDTRSFAESGMVRFHGAGRPHHPRRAGQTFYWLRARLDGTARRAAAPGPAC